MASIYARGDSLWVKYKSADGTWKRKPTGYANSNPGDRKQAAKLREALTRRERTHEPVRASDWNWVTAWLQQRWQGLTLRRHRSSWRHIERYLKAIDCRGPANLIREHCLNYQKCRADQDTSVNTAALELKLLAQVMDEAVVRDYAEENPCRNLRLARTAPKEKQPFTDAQLSTLDEIFASGVHEYQLGGESIKAERYGWEHVTYLLGRYQAARLMSARVPLDCVDLEARRIHYPGGIVKGGKAYTQPIDERLLPDLREIVARRRAAGEATLCEPPVLGSLHWRKLLDSLAMRNVSHHSLRVRWLSDAAKAGIPEAVAMRFSNHSSVDVHRIYLRYSQTDMADALRRLK
jgi:hypothetical protein